MNTRPSDSQIPGSWPTQRDEFQSHVPSRYQPVSQPQIARPINASPTLTQPSAFQPGRLHEPVSDASRQRNSDKPFPELGIFGSMFSRLLNVVSGTTTSATSADQQSGAVGGVSLSRQMTKN